MTKKIISVLFAALILVCVFSACADNTGSGNEANEHSRFLGKWTGVDEGFDVIYVFEADGKGYSEALGLNLPVTYEVDGDNITITTDSTSTMEELMGMSVDELLAQGLLEDVNDLITVQTGTLDGETLIIDGTEYTKSAE